MSLGKEAVGEEGQQNKLGQRQELVAGEDEPCAPGMRVSFGVLARPETAGLGLNIPEVHGDSLVGADILVYHGQQLCPSKPVKYFSPPMVLMGGPPCCT